VGYEYGDAQNSAVRTFLYQFSKQFNLFNPEFRKLTTDFFENKCPYTGVDITKYGVMDHIIPFNRERCGLHVYGNILIVAKEANQQKRDMNLEEYLKDYPDRIRKINEFMNRSGFLDIHNKFHQKLKSHCESLYIKIRETIESELKMFKNIASGKPESIITDDNEIIPILQNLTTDKDTQNDANNTITIKEIVFSLRRNTTENQSIQDFVKETFEKMFNNGIIPLDELHNLYNKDYCSKIFKISYPLVVDDIEKTTDKKGHPRYWKKVKIGGHYLCSQWQKSNFSKYDKFLTDYIMKIAKLNY